MLVSTPSSSSSSLSFVGNDENKSIAVIMTLVSLSTLFFSSLPKEFYRGGYYDISQSALVTSIIIGCCNYAIVDNDEPISRCFDYVLAWGSLHCLWIIGCAIMTGYERVIDLHHRMKSATFNDYINFVWWFVITLPSIIIQFVVQCFVDVIHFLNDMSDDIQNIEDKKLPRISSRRPSRHQQQVNSPTPTSATPPTSPSHRTNQQRVNDQRHWNQHHRNQ